jgi:hypothetical protein
LGGLTLKDFLSRNSHWLAFVIVGVAFFMDLTDFIYFKPDIISVVLGGIAFLSVGYLVFYIEKQKRKQRNEKSY